MSPDSGPAASPPPPGRPLLARWWVWFVLAGGVLVGLMFMGMGLTLVPTGWLGGVPLPDPLLVGALWAGDPGSFAGLLALGLLAVGGAGRGGDEATGRHPRWAGVALSLLLSMAVLAAFSWAYVAAGSGLPSYMPATMAPSQLGTLLRWSGFGAAFLVLWTWLQAPGKRLSSLLQGFTLWALAAVPLGLSLAESYRRMASYSEALYPGLLLVLLAAGLLPSVLVMLAGSRGGRGGLRLSAAFSLLVALGALLAVEDGPPVVDRNVFRDPAVDSWAERGDRRFFPSISALGQTKRLVSYGERQAIHEGMALRLPLPDPSLARGAWSGPNYIGLKDDRLNLSAARSYLRNLMELELVELDLQVYTVLTGTDPLASEEDLAPLHNLPGEFPADGRLAAVVARFLHLRGETAAADDLLSRAMPLLERTRRLVQSAGLCHRSSPGPNCDGYAWQVDGARLARMWPTFSPPYRGTIRVRFDTSLMPSLAADLVAAALPLTPPEKPYVFGSEGTGERWHAISEVQLHPVVDGVVVLSPLPVAKYALEVGFRDYAHPGLEVWLEGLPTEEIEIGPGQWDWATTITLLPENPVPFVCEAGELRWEPYLGASAYQVESWDWWGGTGARVSKSLPIQVMGTSTKVEPLLKMGMWPTYGFRVVPLNGDGNEMVRVYPLSMEAYYSVVPNEDSCLAGSAGGGNPP